MIIDRECAQCGAAFRGGPNARFCPACRAAREEASRARSYAKYKARRQRRRAIWDGEKVVAAILERWRQGLPLNAGAVMIGDGPLMAAARRYYGGWNEALAAAGLDPTEVRLPRRKMERWSPERVIEDIRADAAAGLPLGHRATQQRTTALVRAAAYYFGSWEEAVKAAGYDYAVARSLSRLTPSQVLDRIRSLVAAGVDISEKSCRAWDPNIYAASVGLFGSWEKAVKAAGLNAEINATAARTRKWTEARVIAAIRKRYAQDLPLNYQAVVGSDEALASAARRLFGGWDNALTVAGFDPDRIKQPKRQGRLPPGSWTRERVIESIRADAEAGLPLSTHETQKRWPSLVACGQALFGSWETAISAAGYDYEAVRKTQAWTPDKVIERIRDLSQAGADLSNATCFAYDRSLHGAAATHYGSWPKAVAAAGLDPEETRRIVKWSRSKVVDAIRAGRDDHTLQVVSRRYWGSWSEARRAAGINPEEPEPSDNRIRARREELGLTQAQLSERVGVSRPYISRLESAAGLPPRVGMALRLARALECTVEDIYG